MGTHPIFESDFDCLTVLVWQPRFVMLKLDQMKLSFLANLGVHFAQKLKKALDSVGAKYTVIEIENRKDMDEIQNYMKTKTGGRSVPRVFINGKFYGGGDEPAAGARNGDLKKKISQ